MARRDEKLTAPGYDRWRQRIEKSRKVRDEYVKRVWRPLYRAWVGRLMTMEGRRPEPINPFAQFIQVVRPQLLWDEPVAVVQPARVRTGQDPQQAIQFADILAEQATAIAKAIRLHDQLDRAIFDYFWGFGAVLFGFHVKRGLGQARGDDDPASRKDVVDLDYASSGHNEYLDPGLPFAMAISPLRLLFDLTFGRIDRGQWFAVEYYLTLAEFRALYPKAAGEVRATHTGEPTVLGPGGDEEKGREAGEQTVRMLDIYTRDGRFMTMPDPNSGFQGFLRARQINLGIEGLPLAICGFEWPPDIAYPIPPMAHWYGSAMEFEAFLDKLFDEASRIRSLVFINEGGNANLREQVISSDNEGVIAVKGDPRGVAATVQVGGINRDTIQAFRTAWEINEVASGISEFQMGVRQRGEMSATEASALQSATNVRIESVRAPVLRLAATCFRNLIAVAYAKANLMAGQMFPIQSASGQLKFAGIDPNFPRVGEITDYMFDVGVSQSAQLSREQLGRERMQVLQLVLNPAVQQQLQAEGKYLRLAPIIEEVFQDLRSYRIRQSLVDVPQQPQNVSAVPAGDQGPGAAASPEGQQLAPGPAPATPTQTAIEGPPPGQPGQPFNPAENLIAEYQMLAQALSGIPDGDQREEQILDRMAQIRALLAGMGPTEMAQAEGAVPA